MLNPQGNFGPPQSYYEHDGSQLGSEVYAPSHDMFKEIDDAHILAEKDVPAVYEEVTDEYRETSGRRKWVILVWTLTWWIPNPALQYIGRMKRPDVRMAWREKLALNMLIWLLCLLAVFVIAIMGNLICPRQYVYAASEIAGHGAKNDPNDAYVSLRGEVFSLTQFAPRHYPSVVQTRLVMDYGGGDITNLFPVQVSALCNGITGSVDPSVQVSNINSSDPNAQYHDFRAFTGDSRPDWYFEQMTMLRKNYRLGFVGFTRTDVRNLAGQQSSVAIFEDSVYDLTPYINGIGLIPANSGANTSFLHPAVVQLFQSQAGTDVTNGFYALGLTPALASSMKVCLRNLYFAGMVDHRNDAQCLFARYILLATSIIMLIVIGVKFLAALQFGNHRMPEALDKFVICQVPCYTEDEESLKRTFDSLACLQYDDKRKLLFVICDGMIVGSGNDRPTPRIVLDLLGVDPNVDPEPLSFLSLGEGAKQHNLGKVYSGLYECNGHVVPYVVIVKVGKPTERSRPGNRGKRDSQMILMRFLNKVHFSTEMIPLELEIYHQIKNVIGVNPSFYEYILMVDADTVVAPHSLNRLVAAMKNDSSVMGTCGETSLQNAKTSVITMMQVYEYYISHFLAKAFESLFGSVTCLPGCFCVYRIRTPDGHKPLLISNAIIEDYSENRVDTLHMKNLLHLGEDRYLTTLMMKHFPQFRLSFVKDAACRTVAPEQWKVFISQRRRWINSTVHNLAELMFLESLCGFCCFSMRFIVMLDLFSTLIQPVTVLYLVYLIYLVAWDHSVIPITSMAFLAGIYGLQAVIFILHRKWENIGWMIVYIIAIPVFSFFLPLYAFWHMDDFSWGNTRVVMGEKGKKIIISDEGKFDPKTIPKKKWAEYEQELWELQSGESYHSHQTGYSQSTFNNVQNAGMVGSVYGSAYGSQYSPYAPPDTFHRRSAMSGAASPSYMHRQGQHSSHLPPY